MDIFTIIERIGVVLFGGCVGSFLNVCIYRLPKDESIVKPRSFCPQCKKTIKWYDNIPVLSYIFLGAKCRNCQEKISIRYPVVEAITAALFIILYMHFGLSWVFAKFIFFFCLLVLVSFIDIDYHAIPAYLCVIGIIIGLSFSIKETVKVWEGGFDSLIALPIIRDFRALIFGFGFAYLFKFFGDVFVDIYLTILHKA